MLNLRKVVLACLASSLFVVIPANVSGVPGAMERRPLPGSKASQSAQVAGGCRSGFFVGSYTQVTDFPDVWGDGTNVNHQLMLQLNLHSDGTVTEENAGGPELMLSFGLSTTAVGSWTCRNDGKLVVTAIVAVYGPTTDAINHPSTVPAPPPVDLFLFQHIRFTFLFSVTDANTLTIIQSRNRVYAPNQDPSDPTGGVLQPLNTNVVVYKRLVASDADLLAP